MSTMRKDMSLIGPIDQLDGTCHYKQLPDPASYIRLLEVFADREGSTIRCRLTAWKADQAPSYYAVSYTWGNETPVDAITVEGEATGRMKVRQNLGDVLRRLLSFVGSQYYWIDALCINQDALEEKAHQVAMMSSIFKDAEHVIAYLGEATETDCAYAMREMCEKLEERVGSHPVARTKISAFCDALQFHQRTIKKPVARPVPVRGNIDHLEAEPEIEPPDRVRYTMSLAALSQVPYFSRVWVVQELLLAKSVSFCHGQFHVPLATLREEARIAYEAVSQVVKAPSAHFSERRVAFARNFTHSMGQLKAKIAAIGKAPAGSSVFERDLMYWTGISPCHFNLNFVQLLGIQGTQLEFEPEDALRLLAGLQSHDQRDKIYGGLAFIQPSLRTPLKPDYTISKFELALRVLQHGLNPHLTRCLIGCLNITSEDPDLQAAMSIRQQPANDYQVDAKQPDVNELEQMLKFEFDGLRLDEELVLREYTRDGLNITMPKTRPYHLDVYVPPSIMDGDWILQSSPSLADYGLVLRQVGERFTIVGVAKHRRWERLRGATFQVAFDAEDFLVCVALCTLPEMIHQDTLKISRDPFSSFAELKSTPNETAPMSLETEDE